MENKIVLGKKQNKYANLVYRFGDLLIKIDYGRDGFEMWEMGTNIGGSNTLLAKMPYFEGCVRICRKLIRQRQSDLLDMQVNMQPKALRAVK